MKFNSTTTEEGSSSHLQQPCKWEDDIVARLEKLSISIPSSTVKDNSNIYGDSDPGSKADNYDSDIDSILIDEFDSGEGTTTDDMSIDSKSQEEEETKSFSFHYPIPNENLILSSSRDFTPFPSEKFGDDDEERSKPGDAPSSKTIVFPEEHKVEMELINSWSESTNEDARASESKLFSKLDMVQPRPTPPASSKLPQPRSYASVVRNSSAGGGAHKISTNSSKHLRSTNSGSSLYRSSIHRLKNPTNGVPSPVPFWSISSSDTPFVENGPSSTSHPHDGVKAIKNETVMSRKKLNGHGKVLKEAYLQDSSKNNFGDDKTNLSDQERHEMTETEDKDSGMLSVSGLGSLSTIVRDMINKELRCASDVSSTLGCPTAGATADASSRSEHIVGHETEWTPFTTTDSFSFDTDESGSKSVANQDEENMVMTNSSSSMQSRNKGVALNRCKSNFNYPRRSPAAITRQEHTLTEVCFILDNSNESMTKFCRPLCANFEKFWDLLSSSDVKKFRMSMVTPTEMVDFTSQKAEFLGFTRRVASNTLATAGYKSVTEGLARAFHNLSNVSWDRNSGRYLFILTNLSSSNYDGDDDNMRGEIAGTLRFLVKRHLSDLSGIMVGRWRDDNDILLGALDANNISFATFDFLNVKQMACLIGNDKDLIEALSLSMGTVIDRVKTKVTIDLFERKHQKGETGLRRDDVSEKFITTEALMFQFKPPQSIEEVLSHKTPVIASQECWMKREVRTICSTNTLHLSMGRLGYEKLAWRENVLLRSLKLDKSSTGSKEHYMRFAYISSVAQFLARQYNNDHRPEHCEKIRFLPGYTVEEAAETKRMFYAERYPGCPNGALEYTEYCDAAGKWDDRVASETLLRFVLTCFKLSGGDFMLAGLTGIRKGGAYVLASPSFLSRTVSDPHISQCNKEYMKQFRKDTKMLMERNDWTDKKPSQKKSDETDGSHRRLFRLLS